MDGGSSASDLQQLIFFLSWESPQDTGVTVTETMLCSNHIIMNYFPIATGLVHIKFLICHTLYKFLIFFNSMQESEDNFSDLCLTKGRYFMQIESKFFVKYSF